jgi:hydroxymethylbilane synthase
MPDHLSEDTIKSRIIIGTRGSELALWQANYVKDLLAGIGLDSELKIIKTQGDKILNLSFDKLEGKGFFTKELEEELLGGTIDLAVHSHKDLPTNHPEGLIIAAVSDREDPAELLLILKDCVDVQQKLSVKFGGMVGTSSNRRKAQLLAVRPDLEIEELRGNVITRIQKLRDEKYDAIMLAKAGVLRLGLDLSEFYIEELEPNELIPAPAQGVLAYQIRENDTVLFEKLQTINNHDVAEQIGIERKVLNLFEGGCQMPLGCYCRKDGSTFQIWTSKAVDGTDFPDRLFTQTETADGIAEKIVAKLKYLKLFKDVAAKLDLVSVHPTKLHGASEAWVYDTGKRKLHHYIADDYSKVFSVKGNTLLGFDANTSEMKTLRKPGEQIKEVMGSKPAARKYFKDIKAVGAVPNGRFNESMIILKAF